MPRRCSFSAQFFAKSLFMTVSANNSFILFLCIDPSFSFLLCFFVNTFYVLFTRPFPTFFLFLNLCNYIYLKAKSSSSPWILLLIIPNFFHQINYRLHIYFSHLNTHLSSYSSRYYQLHYSIKCKKNIFIHLHEFKIPSIKIFIKKIIIKF